MKAFEVTIMMQARGWKVATLNKFRAFLKLKPHESFKEINSDLEIAATLETLYGKVDLVELYPGVVAEQATAPDIGQGLCSGSTIAKANLLNIVGLVWGDRHYTVVLLSPTSVSRSQIPIS